VRRAKGLRAKSLKQYLARMNVDYADCFEKSDLERRAAESWMSLENSCTKTPLRQLGNVAGNPRAGYAVVTLDVGGDIGLCDFVIDTGATTALVTPKVVSMLDKGQVTEGAAVRGLTGTGETLRQKVSIKDVRLGAKRFDSFDAVVTDLAAVGLPPYIGGLIGLDLLGQFEIEFDFSTSALSFWPKGAIADGALSVDDLVKIPMRKHPVGLKTVRCSLNGAETFDAIVDMGSFFSVVNWMASANAGIGPDSEKVQRGGLQVKGVDGQTMGMAIAPYDLRVIGETEDLESVYQGMCCVGDLPAFNALGASVSPFMALGLDVIGRNRMVFDASNDAMYLSKGIDADGNPNAFQ